MARSTRLQELQAELHGLDSEIQGLHNFLDEDSDQEEQQFSVSLTKPSKSGSFVGKRSESRLYRESVEVLEKRTHQVNDFANDYDVFQPPRKHLNLKNYKPPSQRIDESRHRRNQSVKRFQDEKEKEFLSECTFKPKINRVKCVEDNYDPSHLVRRQHKAPVQFSETPRKLINKKSEFIAERVEHERGSGFLCRQLSHRRSQSVRDAPQVTLSTRKLTKEEQRMNIEHLSKPRQKQAKTKDAEETPRKKIRSDPSVFEHLVSQSLKKEEIVIEEPKVKPKMNKRSKMLTENKQVNLYEQSLESQMKREKMAEEQKGWDEKQQLSECTFKPKIIRRVPINDSTRVAGMEDFVDRMKKTKRADEHVEETAIPKVRRGTLVQKPFSFDKRTQKIQALNEKDVDSVLSEINELLAIT